MKGENKILLGGVLAAIALLVIAGLSYYSIIYSSKMTGYATSITGTANLTVETSLEINFTDALINWGSGKVDTGKTYAVLDSEGTKFQGNWTTQTNGLTLENIGNVNVSLNLKSGKTNITFIGGTNPSYKWKVTNNETGSCLNTSAYGSYIDVNTTGIGTLFCTQFGYLTAADAVDIDINLTIPYNAQLGAISDIITATASTAI